MNGSCRFNVAPQRLLCAVLMFAGLFVSAGDVVVNGCRASWTDTTLRVGNGLFAREYAALGGRLQTVSFRASEGREWQTRRFAADELDRLQVDVVAARWSPVGVEGVRVDVKIRDRSSSVFVFPSMPGVISSCPPGPPVARERDLERDVTRDWYTSLGRAAEGHDHIAYGLRHVKATSFLCADQTDIRDNLLQKDERMLMDYDSRYTVAATALDCLDVVSGEGVVFVRVAPMPVSRPAQVEDFVIDGMAHRVTMLQNGYPLAELAYCGGAAGRRRALVAFQRALRPYRPGRDGILLSNTWGAGNRDSRICQDFLLKEIEAGARMGVDVIQIDDGWQRGRTQNSRKKAVAGRKKVWSGYWDADPDFWKEDLERFPDGLELLVKKAREHGMRFGLWFGPDSSNEASNWERDADCLLEYHRRLGVDYFKMDSMKLHTPLSLERNRKMFDKMLRGSDGSMVFDLDCTAEVRPGFFGLMDIGPLFVENRYTRKPVYWPHHTLKNLWDLSQVIDPVRLRFEFNNPDTNRGNYDWSPLGHGKYRPDALFATVMAASPLAWMELSDVSDSSMADIASLVKTWKAERARWHGGVIHPVGDRPDGVSWTGFVSESADGKGGYALMFRELNEAKCRSLDLKPIFGSVVLTDVAVIGGRGAARADGSLLSVEVYEPLDFVWVKFAAVAAVPLQAKAESREKRP